MRASLKCLDLIKHYEGCRLVSYLCPSKIWTVGIGHTGTVDGIPVKASMIITEDKAKKLLMNDLIGFENAVTKYVKVKLNQNQFDALVSLVFNIGAGNFLSSTVLRELNAGRYQLACKAMSMWNKGSKKQILNGLVKRRQSEMLLFSTGQLKYY